MSVKDVTSVFGRYFIVGFYLPAFFWLAYLKLMAGSGLVPNEVQANNASAFGVIGIAALLLGLLLQGVRVPLVRLFSGYFVMSLWRTSRRKPLRASAAAMRWLLRRKALREYRHLVKLAGAKGPRQKSESDDTYRTRRLAEFWLEQRFPDSEAKVLPTKFGNRIRAWEDYARTRWSLETVAIRPHIESLLQQQETDLRTDAETDLAFALNASLLASVIALVLGIDRAIEQPPSLWFIASCLTPLLAALALYEIAIVAAVSWGNTVRAAIDLHRLDLYDKLGVQHPTTIADDRAVGVAINQMLLYGSVLPDSIRVTTAAPPTPEPNSSTMERGLSTGAGLVALGLLLGRVLADRRRNH